MWLSLDGFPKIGSDASVHDKALIKEHDERFAPMAAKGFQSAVDNFKRRGIKIPDNLDIGRTLSNTFNVYVFPKGKKPGFQGQLSLLIADSALE